MKLEKYFQRDLIKEIKKMFPGCVVFKTDPNYIQGIPDLLILYGSKWAMLEVKKCAKAQHRPNQDKWVRKLSKMSYASFIFPENKEEILHAITNHFASGT